MKETDLVVTLEENAMGSKIGLHREDRPPCDISRVCSHGRTRPVLFAFDED